MANSALIDDLLKQFAENPRRVFARLANEYRKRGELDSAIEICRSHVPLQPGYISGHIVLGQALYDRGSLDEARGSFETALTLDPENLIALRHMGDIASTAGDTEGAREWYRQLLEIDPQNEEVSAQLASLGASVEAADAEDASAASDELAGWGEVTLPPIDIGGGEPTHDDGDPTARPETESAAAAQDFAGTPDADADVAVPPSASLEIDGIFDDAPEEIVDAEPEPSPAVFAMEGLETTSFAVEAEAGEPVSAEAAPVETTEVEAPSVEAFAVEALSVEDASDANGDIAAHEEGGGTFATETMAELYLQQGFPDRALAIYRDLAARRPHDVSLEERIAELTETGSDAPAPTAPGTVRTAREFFGVLAYRRAPEVFPADPAAADAALPEYTEADSVLTNGRPGREADSALSLDNVFHDAPDIESSDSSNGLSFDEFFARRTNGDVEPSAEAAARPASENGAGDEESADEEEPRDLELFHAWLDGLKG